MGTADDADFANEKQILFPGWNPNPPQGFVTVMSQNGEEWVSPRLSGCRRGAAATDWRDMRCITKIYFTTRALARCVSTIGLVAAATVVLTGCETVPAQSEAMWESWDDEQPQQVWPTDQFGTLHLVDGMPVYDLGQLPPQKYSALGFIYVNTVAAPGQSGAVDERMVVAEARRRGGQAALLSKKPKPPLQPVVQQTDYLVVKFEKDPLRSALELIDAYLSWSAANTNGYTSSDGRVKLSAGEIAARRTELEAERQLILSRLPPRGGTNAPAK